MSVALRDPWVPLWSFTHSDFVFANSEDAPFMSLDAIRPKLSSVTPGVQKQMLKELLEPHVHIFRVSNTNAAPLHQKYNAVIDGARTEAMLWTKILVCETSLVHSLLGHIVVALGMRGYVEALIVVHLCVFSDA